MKYGAAERSTVALRFYYFNFPPHPRPTPWNRLFLTVLPASACTLRRVMKRRCLTCKGTTMRRKVKSSVLFWNTKQLTVSVIKTLAVLYAGLRTSCLKVIREKILFNYSWSDCYRARRKSLETMNWHCLLLFRLISLWMMQFRPSFLESGNSQFSQSANRYQKVAANL